MNTFSDTKINKAYAANTALGSLIGRADVDASKLTLEQVKALCNWADWQSCSTFEDRDGNGFPLQAILDLWHASIVYDTFECWFENEPKKARSAYIAICRKHKIKRAA